MDDAVVVVVVVVAGAAAGVEAVVWAGARVEDAVYGEWRTEKVDAAAVVEYNN